jgi:molybdenum cofactor biosynthesis protein B
MRTHEKHKSEARKRLKVGVITISTSRYYNSLDGLKVRDESGDSLCRLARARGHTVLFRSLVPDDPLLIRLKTLEAARQGVDAIITTGGTGVSRTDVTIEALSPLIDRELPGFGELFRSFSFKSVGTSAMMSRALLGTMNGIVVACLPGSPDSVRVGMKILLEELPHLVSLAS